MSLLWWGSVDPKLLLCPMFFLVGLSSATWLFRQQNPPQILFVPQELRHQMWLLLGWLGWVRNPHK